jgi:hypothetical protein
MHSEYYFYEYYFLFAGQIGWMGFKPLANIFVIKTGWEGG